MKVSLNFRINIVMLLVVTMFFSISGLSDYMEEIRTKTQDLHDYLNSTSDRLSQTLLLPVWDFDYDKIEELIKAEMKNKDLMSIAIFSVLSPEIISGRTRDKTWKVVSIKDSLKDAKIQKTINITQNNKAIARITVQVTDKFVKKEVISATTNRIIKAALLMFLLIISLAFGVFYSVLKPIHKLTRSVRAISKGNIDEHIEITRNDELGELASDFSFMRDTIKQKIDAQQNEIKERIKAEDELRNLQNYLNNIIDSMPSIMVGVNSEGLVTQWNKRAEKVTGISTDMAQGKKLESVLPRMNDEMDIIFESIRSKETKHDRKRRKNKENTLIYEDIIIYPLMGNGVEGAVVRIDNVSKQVLMEEMMIQSEKMLSIGGLAAGMAHEINNPLAGMMQTASVMGTRLEARKEVKANVKASEKAGASLESIRMYMQERGIPRMVQSINESGVRIAEIINNMLSLSRKSKSQVEPHEITDILDKTLDLASTDYDLKKGYDFKRIIINKEYSDKIPIIYCEAGKIQQVFFNIFKNGAQAMHEATTIDPKFIIRAFYDSNRKMVCIKIEDNGPGMPETIRKRIFEPFFTTKAVGLGTGLGLSVSYFIITENHRGEMGVESTPGKGSIFTINLPENRPDKQ